MPHRSAAHIARAIDQAMGRVAPDLVITDVRLFDLVTGDAHRPPTSRSAATRSSATYGRYRRRTRRSTGAGASRCRASSTRICMWNPRSSTPLEFDRCVLPHGVTTAICDPHEMANVIGTAAFDYFLACAERTIMDLRVKLSSCVPATHLETSGARIDAADLVALPRPSEGDRACRVHELSRASSPGDPACLAKLEAFAGSAYRRARAAGARARSQRLSVRRHPHRPRDDDAPRKRSRRSARA